MSVKIELYTRNYCTHCQRAKALLRIKGVNFVEYNITDDHPRTSEIQRINRQETMPGIFINDMLVGGCKELFELDEKGDLDVLLGKVVSPVGSPA